MIKQFTKVDKFGILSIPQPSNNLKQFNSYNIIYGWNGSGKTTLGRLFRSLETRANPEAFKDGSFSVDLSEKKINSTNLDHQLEVRVFNQDFVNENLDLFEAKTKAIIFISKEKIKEKKELDITKVALKKISEERQILLDKKQALLEKIDKSHKDAGKNIKDFLLGTVYANVTYNKATSSNRIWPSLKSKVLSGNILTDQSLEREKSLTLVNSSMTSISEELLPQLIEKEKFSEFEREVNNVLAAQITSKVIDRLKDNPQLSEWIREGLNIHKSTTSDKCEFCGENIKPERLLQLEEHYSKEYNEFIEAISILISKLEKGMRNNISDITHSFYPELISEFENGNTEFAKVTSALNKQMGDWIKNLTNKRSNPFSRIEEVSSDPTLIDNYNLKLEGLKKVFQKHNQISSSHGQLAEAAKTKIENHFVAQIALAENFNNVDAEITDLEIKITSAEEAISVSRKRIADLEGELKNDKIAIREINEFLHKFLGRNEINLERIETGGYQLKRDGIAASNLSEGEKTAISLIYFFSKIKENDANIKNLVIILDDPISSFDSNHLFNASSFIKKYVEGSQQLFVLTHNFWFFKQVRDWMLKKNDKKDENGNPIIVCNIYNIERGILKNAGQPLTRFHSEYQHVFNTILSYQDANDIDDASCFAIANSSRRLLEAFTSFKTPDNSGFNGALQLGEKNGLDSAKKERIHYFLNKYSHLDRIESFDNTVETLLEEGQNVVNDVLWLIKKSDNEHYNSMLKICGFTDKLI